MPSSFFNFTLNVCFYILPLIVFVAGQSSSSNSNSNSNSESSSSCVSWECGGHNNRTDPVSYQACVATDDNYQTGNSCAHCKASSNSICQCPSSDECASFIAVFIVVSVIVLVIGCICYCCCRKHNKFCRFGPRAHLVNAHSAPQPPPAKVKTQVKVVHVQAPTQIIYVDQQGNRVPAPAAQPQPQPQSQSQGEGEGQVQVQVEIKPKTHIQAPKVQAPSIPLILQITPPQPYVDPPDYGEYGGSGGSEGLIGFGSFGGSGSGGFGGDDGGDAGEDGGGDDGGDDGD